MRKILLLVHLFLCSIDTMGQNTYVFATSDSTFIKQDLISKIDSWYKGDIYKDSILGISYTKSLEYLQKFKIKDTVTIAILDMPVDIEMLISNSSLWLNKNEIPNNQIDDDNNGYVDDIHGWNFLGEIGGNQQIFGKYDYTRILQKYLESVSNTFESNKLDSIQNYSRNKLLIKASKLYKEQLQYAKKELSYAKMIERILYESRINLKPYLSSTYSLKELDSLKPLISSDTLMEKSLLRLHNFKKYGFTESYIRDYNFKAKGRLDYLLNPLYEDRELLADDRLSTTSDSTVITQGNNILNNALYYLDHGVLMSNFISDQRYSQNIPIKIMPIIISCLGDEYDKDIYRGIKYAVDNGARVINMSFSKSFSTDPDIVKKAIQYADDKEVVIVTSAGNSGLNIDLEGNTTFPNDRGLEVKNFITVGSTNGYLNTKLISEFSNYGKDNVDLFAPGEEIKILNSLKEIETQEGTSVSAALVSKTIGLILSYFPDLTAAEIKDILIKSVTKIEGEVILENQSSPKRMDFEITSGSGGILNAFKAVKMAEELSRRK